MPGSKTGRGRRQKFILECNPAWGQPVFYPSRGHNLLVNPSTKDFYINISLIKDILYIELYCKSCTQSTHERKLCLCLNNCYLWLKYNGVNFFIPEFFAPAEVRKTFLFRGKIPAGSGQKKSAGVRPRPGSGSKNCIQGKTPPGVGVKNVSLGKAPVEVGVTMNLPGSGTGRGQHRAPANTAINQREDKPGPNNSWLQTLMQVNRNTVIL